MEEVQWRKLVDTVLKVCSQWQERKKNYLPVCPTPILILTVCGVFLLLLFVGFAAFALHLIKEYIKN